MELNAGAFASGKYAKEPGDYTKDAIPLIDGVLRMCIGRAKRGVKGTWEGVLVDAIEGSIDELLEAVGRLGAAGWYGRVVDLLVISLYSISLRPHCAHLLIAYITGNNHHFKATLRLALIRSSVLLDFLAPDRALDLRDGWRLARASEACISFCSTSSGTKTYWSGLNFGSRSMKMLKPVHVAVSAQKAAHSAGS